MTDANQQTSPVARLRRPRPVLPSMWQLPHGSEADDDGVVGVGADLEPGTLADAYMRGIFPWPHADMPLPWFSPNPRAVIPTDGVRVSRSLARLMRRVEWHTTVNAAFESVMRGCATRVDQPTWINESMIKAYGRLHDLSWAHSIEVWDGKRLIGGVYGVQIGAVFTAESMFYRESNASKVALVALAARFREAGGMLIDAQVLTEHLETLGAITVPRATFLHTLEKLREHDVRMRTDAVTVNTLAPE